MSSGILLLFVFIIALIAGGIWLWKKGYLNSLFTPSVQLRANMRILWAEKESDEINEAIIAEVSPNGQFIRFEGRETWTNKSEILVKAKWPVPKKEEPEVAYKIEPKKTAKSGVKAGK